MRTAADIMTPNPKMVASGESLLDVINLFLEQGITSSPVINPLGEILGVLSELSLLKAFMLHKARFEKSNKVGHHIELMEPMSVILSTAPLIEVVKEVLAAPTHRLLVKDDKDKIIGIISPKDLMRTMIGQQNPSLNIKQKLIETEVELKKSLLRLQTTEKHLEVYQRVFHETPYMMHAVDAQGTILMANRSECEALGYKPGELIGKSIFDLYAAPMHEEARKGLEKVKETGHHNMTYTTLIKKNGTPLRCDIVSSALYDENKKFISTITVLRPVDSEELLRILHGIVDDTEGPLAKYALMKKS